MGVDFFQPVSVGSGFDHCHHRAVTGRTRDSKVLFERRQIDLRPRARRRNGKYIVHGAEGMFLKASGKTRKENSMKNPDPQGNPLPMIEGRNAHVQENRE